MLKLSIVVPAYNIEKYIRKCLESILSCPSREFEVIVIDDGSSDRTFKIISQIASNDERVRAYRQENRGLSGARNEAVKKSSGEYLMFVDGDDWVSPDAVACILNETEKAYDVISFNFKTWQGNGRNPNHVYRHKYSGLKSTYANGADFLTEALRKDYYFTWYVWAHVFKRQVLADSHIWFWEGMKYEDIAFTYKAICQCKSVRVIDRDFIIYRMNNLSSITAKKELRSETDRLYVLDENRKDIRRMQVSRELKKLLLNNMGYNYCSVLVNCACVPLKEREQLLIELESKKYLLNDICCGKPWLAALCGKIFGIRVLAGLLGFRFRIRKNGLARNGGK